MFHVGQKVVCIKSYGNAWRNLRDFYGVCFPQKKVIYTIRNLDSEGTELGIRLIEVVNPTLDCWSNVSAREVSWPASCFRPVVERKTDISIFTRMLDSTKQPANV